MRLAALVLLAWAGGAHAKCRLLAPRCLCDVTPQWVAKVNATSASEGTVAEVFTGATVPDAGSPPTVGATISLGGFSPAKTGDVVLMDDLGTVFVLVDDGKTARCGNVDTPADDWARAVAGGTCGTVLNSHSFKQPDCNDRGPLGCSTSSGVGVGCSLLALILFWRRRRQ
ncbi:MAG: hypothetical protein QM723_01135 [Myxococcaceae bacterium]